MTTRRPTESFVTQVHTALAISGIGHRRISRILAEVTDHLNESVAVLRARGLADDHAQRQAIARFGTPADFAQSFTENAEEEHTMDVRALIRLGTYGLAALTISAGLIDMAFTASSPSPEAPGRISVTGWIVLKLAADAIIIAVSVLTLLHLRGRWLELMPLTATGTLVLGVLATIWASVQVLAGPDPEYYLPMIGIVIAGQGLGLLLIGVLRGRAPAMA